MNAKVAVAMSGGVDSSVAAALLIEQGYEVFGIMLRLWSEPNTENENRCCTPDSMAQARRVASILDIPFYALDAQNFFYKTIVSHFIEGYARGITPNPCLICNRQVRWDFLYQHALNMGANYMATGHYARISTNDSKSYELRKAIDQQKDQSYVLHVLRQDQLMNTLLPLGNYTKQAIRQLAHNFNLPVAERPDSQDLCFLGNDDYRSFLRRNAPDIFSPGPIVDKSGNKIGEHTGLSNYTIGQRKGLGISSQTPYYVIRKDPASNTLVIGKLEELGQNKLLAESVNWISGYPPNSDFRAQIKVRYKATPAWGSVQPIGADQAEVLFDYPLRDITPGQAAVFYQEDLVIGGGIISG
jgi:tRNA-specific 2-thiouridylase